MAIVGKLTHLDWFFKAYPMLEEVRDYSLKALNPTSDIHNRIFNLNLSQAEDRKEMSYTLSHGVRAIEQSYRLKLMKDAFFETHRAFIDFQLIIDGYEYVSIGDKDTFDIKIPYNECKDLIVYENATPNNTEKDSHIKSSTLMQDMPKMRDILLFSESNTPCRTNLFLSRGDLAIFFPEDVHAGGLWLGENAQESNIVKKTVLKVPIYLLNLD